MTIKKNNRNNKKAANPMWGGHFDSAQAAIMEKINASISFDQKFYRQDILASIAHCDMLIKKKIITAKEGDNIKKGLEKIKEEIASGKMIFKTSLEDIHMNIEHRLQQLIGDTAGKLHTARSRNDQVATDFKIFTREAFDYILEEVKILQKALLTKAEQHYESIMPGFTHLQTAQPVTVGHHLLAYVEMFGRDQSRIKDARTRLNECPLGAAALAGTSFPIDRKITAKTLAFAAPTRNSIDSVSDRDFAIEFLFVCSTIAMHLSRLAEEIVIWSSSQFAFVKLSDQYTTGSSIMPQKRNPDAAELIRAKTGRIYGSLITLLTVMKGLSLTYSKDMQEDKEPVFDVFENIILCIKAMTGMIEDISFNTENLYKAAKLGYSTATDLADWLVQNLNIPFRQAHKITGQIVKLAEKAGCELSELPLAKMQSIEKKIDDSIYKVLTVEASVTSRKSYGGTAPSNVKKAIKEAKKRFNI